MKKLNKKGFTIVELVIVIAVIAILAAVLIPTFSGVVSKANTSAATQSARNALTAGLQVSSNASLPEGTKIFVDSDKDGNPDYLFDYDGSAMEQIDIVDEDGEYLTDTITKTLNNVADNLIVTSDYVTTQYVRTTEAYDADQTYYTYADGEYTKVTSFTEKEVDDGAWVAGEGNSQEKDDEENLEDDEENLVYKFYVIEYKLNTVIENDLKAITGATSVVYNEDTTVTFLTDKYTMSYTGVENDTTKVDGLYITTNGDGSADDPYVYAKASGTANDGTKYYTRTVYTYNVYTAPDMPVGTFILVYLG